MENPQFCENLGLEWFSLSTYGWQVTDGKEIYPYSIGYVKNSDKTNNYQVINFAGVTVATKSLQNRIPESEHGNIILLDSLPNQLIDPSFGYHVAANVALMQGMNLRGEEAIDFGSGTGLLSFIGFKRGLRKSVMIEADKKVMNIAKESYLLNNFPSGSGVFIHDLVENLSNTEYKVELQTPTIAIANIGPQPCYGGKNGLQEKVRRFIQTDGTGIKAAILGGFGDMAELRPEYIEDKYAEMGFKETKRTWVQRGETTAQIAVLLTRE